MAYNTKYRLEFSDEYNRQKRVDLLQDGYTGETITEKAGVGFSPLSISIQGQGEDKYNTIKSTEISLSLYSDNFEFQQITEATDTEFLLKVYEAPTVDGPLSLKHIGYVIPEIYGEPYTVAPYGVTIKSTSLGLLNNIRYLDAGSFYTGEATLMTILTRCLNKLDYQLDIWDSINIYEDSQTDLTDSPLNNIKIDQEAFIQDGEALPCIEVIENILKPLVVNFFQDYGRWVIIPMELRATQRAVREYDYQGTFLRRSNYNPLNENYNWINQDQNLEFRPKVREVNVIYEHGLPKDAVGNADFNKPFTQQSVVDDTIDIPEDWVISNASDFTAFGFLKGLREVSAPNDENGPKAVALDSDFLADGAYIEYDGTKFIDVDATDQLLFRIRYAGTAYTRNSDDNDQNYIPPTVTPDISIDHKFQIKLGSYYLKANGEWTTTETDIILNDLGDAVSGCSTLELRDLGIASRFRTFEIPSEDIPEDGTLRVRIYKPESENEGQFVGDTIAKCAYSLFSITPYPDGEPPEEETEFTEEKNVAVYSDSIDYDIKHGDGPTNLHLSSYLEDTTGNFIKTNSWTRGDVTGTLVEVITNTLFKEYENQSWLIRGTQKVRGLFDRWFFEYDKAYTPLSGTYDERLCRFNGELIQIQNAEIDVFGEELPAPENFRVEVYTEPEFDPDTEFTFYYLSHGGFTGDPSILYKSQGSSLGGVTNLDSYVFPSESEETGIENVLYEGTDVIVLRNGKIAVLGSSDTTDAERSEIWVFDSDLNLLANVSRPLTNEPSFQIWTDTNSNIFFYDRDLHELIKYDDSLNVIWTFSLDSLTGITVNNNIRFWGGGITANFFWGVFSNFNFGESSQAFFVNLSDGSLNKQTAPPFSTGTTVDSVRLFNFDDGGFIVINSGSNAYANYELDGTLIDSGSWTDTNVSHFYPLPNGDYMVNDSGSSSDIQLKRIQSDGTLVYQSNFGSDKGQQYASYPLQGEYFYVILNWDNSPRSGNIYVFDGENGDDYFVGNISSPAGKKVLAMPYENWTLRNVVQPPSPNIENVNLTASPSTETVPFTSVINFGADNSGGSDVTINLLLDGSVVDSLTIPAGSTGTSSSYSAELLNPGTYIAEFAGESVTITANGDTTTGGTQGWIDIDSSATDDTIAIAPEATIYVTDSVNADSDCSGGDEFNITFKLNTICVLVGAGMTPNTLATTLASEIDQNMTGLNASYTGISASGYPTINMVSTTLGTADNGEIVNFNPAAALGGTFLTSFFPQLRGGVDEYTLSENIDILIGGSVFATTSPITAGATAETIAQEIFNACDAVGSSVYDFALNGTRILVGSTGGAETLDLDIKNAGFTFSVRSLQ